MANIQDLATKAAARLHSSSDKSDLRFFNISREVVIGSGISNKNDVTRIARQVGDELRRRSASVRTSHRRTCRETM